MSGDVRGALSVMAALADGAINCEQACHLLEMVEGVGPRRAKILSQPPLTDNEAGFVIVHSDEIEMLEMGGDDGMVYMKAMHTGAGIWIDAVRGRKGESVALTLGDGRGGIRSLSGDQLPALAELINVAQQWIDGRELG